MTNILKHYSENGKFIFKQDDDLIKVCNAPNNKCGVYLFKNLADFQDDLYIGCSGHITNTGIISVRKSGCGGIKDRIVNGHQFGKFKRFNSLPRQMLKDNINALEIHWYVTFNEEINHSPIFVESNLLQTYYDHHGKLPRWNLKF